MLQSIASAIQIFQFEFQRLLHVVVACGVLHVPKKKERRKKNPQTLRPVPETVREQPTSTQVGCKQKALMKNFARYGVRNGERRLMPVMFWFHMK